MALSSRASRWARVRPGSAIVVWRRSILASITRKSLRSGSVATARVANALASKKQPTVHAMRNDLDETDRRLMAIDHHINSQNHELAREIEALRQEEK